MKAEAEMCFCSGWKAIETHRNPKFNMGSHGEGRAEHGNLHSRGRKM